MHTYVQRWYLCTILFTCVIVDNQIILVITVDYIFHVAACSLQSIRTIYLGLIRQLFIIERFAFSMYRKTTWVLLLMAMGVWISSFGCGSGSDSSSQDTGDNNPAVVECADGVDNDGDGLVDWQFDLGCVGPGDLTEGGMNNQLDDGWTVFEPAADTTIVYVSSSTGDDNWSGLAPEWDGVNGPKRSIAEAIALMQDGKPDWLLFKRGDTWIDETMGNWKISGRSAAEPVIIASYGEATERPRFEVNSTWLFCHGGGGASEQRSHVRILGVNVYMYSKAPDDRRFTGGGGSCLQWLRDGGDVLVEDIKCEYAQFNLQSNPTGLFTVRRSVFTHSYSLNSHAQNMYTSIGSPLVIEENVFNHGGWNDDFRLALWSPEPDASVWAGVTQGRFGMNFAGVHHDIAGLDFSAATTMDDVASIVQAAINASVGPNSVQLLFTQGNAFQFRAPNFESGPNYEITAYAGSDPGTDLDDLFDVANIGTIQNQGCPESTIFNRNMYLAYGQGNTTVRGNIDANGASGGVQQRMGGVNEENLFIRNPHAVIFGSSQNLPDQYVGGVIRNNVVLGSRDIDTQIQGSGIVITSSAQTEDESGHSLIQDLDIYGNILAHNVYGTGNFKAISLQGDGPHENVNIYDNIVYDWARPQWPDPMDQRAHCMRLTCASGSTVALYDNMLQQPNGGFLIHTSNDADGVDLHHNIYWSSAPDPPDQWSRGWFSLGSSVSMADWLTGTGETQAVARQVQFVDPNRTIETYMAALGEQASYDAFIAQALSQSKYNWDEAYTSNAVNDYIRAGFMQN